LLYVPVNRVLRRSLVGTWEAQPYATQTRVFLRVFSHLLIVFFQRVNDTI